MYNSVANKISSCFRITRPFISSIAGFISIAAYIFSTNYIIDHKILLLFLVVFLTSSFGFVLNDYFDADKDSINHKERILPSGKLQKREAAKLVIALGLNSLLLSIFVDKIVLIINIFTIITLSLYSFINNKYGVWANILTSILSSFTIIIGMALGDTSLVLLLLALSCFFLIFGREIILDLRDFQSDKQIGKTSIPIKYGYSISILLSGMLLSLATFTVLLIFININNTYFESVLAFSLLLIWAGYIFLITNRTSKGIERYLIFTRVAFILFGISLIA